MIEEIKFKDYKYVDSYKFKSMYFNLLNFIINLQNERSNYIRVQKILNVIQDENYKLSRLIKKRDKQTRLKND